MIFLFVGGFKMSKYRYKITNDNKAKVVAKLRKEGVAYWQLAQVFDCHENTVAKMMRNPSDEQVEILLAAIDEAVQMQE